MALTERSRHKLYESFSVLIDDEQAVEEMLSYFPARDAEEPVTKDFLRAELQTELGEMRNSVGGLRTELHTELAAVRIEISDLRTELHSEIAVVRVDMGELRTEMHRMARVIQAWIVTTGISMAGLMLAIARFG